jgi:hypothetical protein
MTSYLLLSSIWIIEKVFEYTVGLEFSTFVWSESTEVILNNIEAAKMTKLRLTTCRILACHKYSMHMKQSNVLWLNDNEKICSTGKN